MVESIARITLDVQDLSTSVTVSAKHGDTGRKIVIALSDGGFLYEVGPDCYAVLTAEKPDGSILFNHCDIEGNCIVYAFTEQTTAVVGVFPCEVKLYGADDALITTARFRIIVDGTVYNDGRVESKDEISALTHLISQVSEAKENAEQAAEDGAAAVQSSLLALENADEAIRTANTAANNANLAAEEANKYLPVATEALQTAGAAVQTANEAKQGVNTLREVVSKFHSNIVETATGEVIQLSDASDLELVGLNIDGTGTPETVTVTIAGKNLFPLEPFNPHTSNGITVSYEGCGIRLSGALENAASTGYVKQWLDYAYIYPPGTYTLSFSALCQPQIVVRFLNVAGNSQLASIQNVSEMKKTITLNEPFMVGWAVYRNAKYDENKPTEPVRIQLEQGRMMSEWEQYKKIQTFTADTPINLTETDLHTNYSNTTIFNDAGADMEVSYIADTQKYVDKKFEALEAAIANLI